MSVLTSLLFFLILPHPPSSTLFPYTTLFRSASCAGGDQYASAVRIWDRSGLRRHIGDRKSTRLNSSHANISYAVFCLKKKNTDGGWHSFAYVCSFGGVERNLKPHYCHFDRNG